MGGSRDFRLGSGNKPLSLTHTLTHISLTHTLSDSLTLSLSRSLTLSLSLSPFLERFGWASRATCTVVSARRPTTAACLTLSDAS